MEEIESSAQPPFSPGPLAFAERRVEKVSVSGEMKNDHQGREKEKGKKSSHSGKEPRRMYHNSPFRNFPFPLSPPHPSSASLPHPGFRPQRHIPPITTSSFPPSLSRILEIPPRSSPVFCPYPICAQKEMLSLPSPFLLFSLSVC